MPAPTSSSAAERIMIGSIGAEGRGAGRRAVGAELDLLDPRLRCLEPRLALLLQAVAFAVELDRGVERRLAALQLAHDLFEPLERVLEGKGGNVLGYLVSHGRCFDPLARAG